MTYEPGDVVAGYTLVRLLGKGGMGSVYLAKHPRLPRHDALKLLSDAYSGDATYRTRFEREADLAAQLGHRNIVAVYDRGAENGRLWIAMQYVDGTDAAQALRRGPMHASRAAHIVSEIGAGLHYAHLHGMVHRDVKPANILLQDSADSADPENVLLADFGIAKIESSSATLTGEGNFLGTLPYTAPEVLDGAPPAPGVDIYALGCVLFELLTGRVPFPVTSPLAAMNAHMNMPPPRASEVVFGVPAALDAVVQRAMAKDPADRFASCREMSVAVRAAVYIDRAEPSETDRAAASETADAAERPRPPYTLTVRRYAADGTVEQLGPIDTSAGSPAERGALETMLRAAGYFSMPLRLPLVRKIDGDPFIELTVAGGGRERTVGFEREGSRHPIELGLIIERLEQVTMWRRTDGDISSRRPPTDVSQPIPAATRPPSRVIGAPASPPSGGIPAPGGPHSQPIPALGGPYSQPIPAAGGPRSQPIPAAGGPRSGPTSVVGPPASPPDPAAYPPQRAGYSPHRAAYPPQPHPPHHGRPQAPIGHAAQAPTGNAAQAPGQGSPVPYRPNGPAGPGTTGVRRAELIGFAVAGIVAFSLFIASPVAGLVGVVLVVAVAAVLLAIRYRG